MCLASPVWSMAAVAALAVPPVTSYIKLLYLCGTLRPQRRKEHLFFVHSLVVNSSPILCSLLAMLGHGIRRTETTNFNSNIGSVHQTVCASRLTVLIKQRLGFEWQTLLGRSDSMNNCSCDRLCRSSVTCRRNLFGQRYWSNFCGVSKETTQTAVP